MTWWNVGLVGLRSRPVIWDWNTVPALPAVWFVTYIRPRVSSMANDWIVEPRVTAAMTWLNVPLVGRPSTARMTFGLIRK